MVFIKGHLLNVAIVSCVKTNLFYSEVHLCVIVSVCVGGESKVTCNIAAERKRLSQMMATHYLRSHGLTHEIQRVIFSH